MSQPDDFAPSMSQRMSEAQQMFELVAQNQRLLGIAAIINSALVLTAIFVAGLLTGNEVAWKLAVCTMALCYIGPMVQLQFPAQRMLATVLTIGSIIFGIIALFALIGHF